MAYNAINFENKLKKFSEHWSPKIIAQMNDYHFKLGKVNLKAGEMFVVPAGVEHKPIAEKECKILLIEPAGTVNTGDERGSLTAEHDVWI